MRQHLAVALAFVVALVLALGIVVLALEVDDDFIGMAANRLD